MEQREAEALSEAECRRPVTQLLRPAFWSLLLMVPALCLAGCGESQGDEEKVSVTSGKHWDCKAGYSNWQLGWSPTKIDWCCNHKKVACHSTSAPFDCKAGAKNWEKGWSKKKKNWCCTYFVIGCSKDDGKKSDSGSEDKTSTSKAQIKISTSTVPPNAGDFVTDKCWSKHQAMPRDAQTDPSPKHCAAFNAMMCTWEQAGSKEKMCFPKICVAKHLEKEIADKGQSPVKDFMCHKLQSSKAHEPTDKTSPSKDAQITTSTSKVPPNAGDFVTDKCWSQHQSMPSDAQVDPSPNHCAAFHARMCTWEQAGSKQKMCFPKICVAKHLEKEIADKGRAEVKDFMCHELQSSKGVVGPDKADEKHDAKK